MSFSGELALGPLVLERPQWLLGLVPLAIMSLLHHGAGRDDWERACDPALLAFLRPPGPAQRDRRRSLILAVAGLVVLALAGPARESGADPRFRSNAGLVVVLDVSPSMDLPNPPPSRLAAARTLAAEAIDAAKGRQVALVVFAGDAYVLSPFSTDPAASLAALDGVQPGMVPEKGSRPAAGLRLAGLLLDQAGIADGEVLLVGDGGGIDSSVVEAARSAGRRLGTALAGPAIGVQALESLATAGGARCACGGGLAVAEIFERPVWAVTWPDLSTTPETGRTFTPLLWPVLMPALLLLAVLLGRRPA
jgi:Ca-activated chloride channel family protein